jgi:hypothetical protein
MPWGLCGERDGIRSSLSDWGRRGNERTEAGEIEDPGGVGAIIQVDVRHRARAVAVHPEHEVPGADRALPRAGAQPGRHRVWNRVGGLGGAP